MTSMNVSLTPELIQIVQQKVESGLYSNASEVVREAIRQLDMADAHRYEMKLEMLKRELEPGLRQVRAGQVSYVSREEMNRRIDKRMDEMKRSKNR